MANTQCNWEQWMQHCTQGRVESFTSRRRPGRAPLGALRWPLDIGLTECSFIHWSVPSAHGCREKRVKERIPSTGIETPGRRSERQQAPLALPSCTVYRATEKPVRWLRPFHHFLSFQSWGLYSPLAFGFLGIITYSLWTACPFKVLTLCCRRSTHFWPKWWNLQPNEKEYVQLMKKRQWTIIYRLFGRGKMRETWRTLFPALVPVKSSFNFMQIVYPRKENCGL